MENYLETNQSGKVRTCCVCRGDSFRSYYSGSIDLIRCRGCGYVTQDPIPSINPETIAGNAVDTFLSSGEKWMTPSRRRNLADIARRVSIRMPGARVLDVGCGDGMFIHLCREAGLEAEGIEPHAGLAKKAEDNSGGKVTPGMYRPDSFPENSFDIISFIHSLEHFTDPAKAIDTAVSHLKPGGWIVIDMPSIRSPHWLLWRLTRISKLIDNSYGVISEHIGYFTPLSVRKIMYIKGLHIKRLTAGRWRYRYSGILELLGLVLDPLFNLLGVGGIFCIAEKRTGQDSVDTTACQHR